MKKGKIIVAKISVVILTIFLIIVSTLKLIDHLNKPISRFHDALNSSYNDLLSVLNTFNSNDLYQTLDGDSIELAIDTKVSAEGLGDTKYSNYADMINNSTYLSNIKLDRKNNYLVGILNINSETNPYTINYVEDKNMKFLYASGEKPTRLLSDTKLKAFNPTKISYLIEIIKNEIDKTIKDENIKTGSSTIAINNESYDVEESIYEISGDKLEFLISSITASLINNSNTQNYLMEIYGVNRNEVKSQLNNYTKSLNINQSTNYAFKAYSDAKTKHVLKFALITNNEDEKEIASYSMKDKYHMLEIRRDDIIHSYKLDTVNNVTTFVVQNEDNIITITKSKENSKVNGKITIENAITKKEDYVIDYSYLITTNASGAVSMALNATIQPSYISKSIKVNIISSILITKNANVAKESIYEYETESEKKELNYYIDKYLELYNQITTN